MIIQAHQQLAQLLLDRRVQRAPVRGLRGEVNLQNRNHTILLDRSFNTYVLLMQFFGIWSLTWLELMALKLVAIAISRLWLDESVCTKAIQTDLTHRQLRFENKALIQLQISIKPLGTDQAEARGTKFAFLSSQDFVPLVFLGSNEARVIPLWREMLVRPLNTLDTDWTDTFPPPYYELNEEPMVASSHFRMWCLYKTYVVYKLGWERHRKIGIWAQKNGRKEGNLEQAGNPISQCHRTAENRENAYAARTWFSSWTQSHMKVDFSQVWERERIRLPKMCQNHWSMIRLPLKTLFASEAQAWTPCQSISSCCEFV